MTQLTVNGDFRYYAYALYYSKLGFVGEYIGSEYFGNKLYQLDLEELFSKVGGHDYAKLPDPYGQDKEPAYKTEAVLHGLILYAKARDASIVVLPTHLESYLNFCRSVEPDFIPRLKKSFLTNSVVEFLFEEYLPLAEVSRNVFTATEFVDGFRIGVKEIVTQFDASYRLNPEQVRWIREYVADQLARVLKYLNPVQLKKLIDIDLTTAADIAETAIDAVKLLPWPIPIGLLIESAKKLHNHERFKAEHADFGLSLILLQQLLISKSKPAKPETCRICNLSVTEIDSYTHGDVLAMMQSAEFCKLHWIGFLHIRKMFGLTGPELLKAVKVFSLDDLASG
jgi:hypothetical protein